MVINNLTILWMNEWMNGWMNEFDIQLKFTDMWLTRSGWPLLPDITIEEPSNCETWQQCLFNSDIQFIDMTKYIPMLHRKHCPIIHQHQVLTGVKLRHNDRVISLRLDDRAFPGWSKKLFIINLWLDALNTWIPSPLKDSPIFLSGRIQSSSF